MVIGVAGIGLLVALGHHALADDGGAAIFRFMELVCLSDNTVIPILDIVLHLDGNFRVGHNHKADDILARIRNQLQRLVGVHGTIHLAIRVRNRRLGNLDNAVSKHWPLGCRENHILPFAIGNVVAVVDSVVQLSARIVEGNDILGFVRHKIAGLGNRVGAHAVHGNVVFGGSGAPLVACDNLGRVNGGMRLRSIQVVHRVAHRSLFPLGINVGGSLAQRVIQAVRFSAGRIHIPASKGIAFTLGLGNKARVCRQSREPVANVDINRLLIRAVIIRVHMNHSRHALPTSIQLQMLGRHLIGIPGDRRLALRLVVPADEHVGHAVDFLGRRADDIGGGLIAGQLLLKGNGGRSNARCATLRIEGQRIRPTRIIEIDVCIATGTGGIRYKAFNILG